jgi:predicted nucleic-acid-binding Zn-ribbon protein
MFNFARAHQTLCVTPAMEAGLADHVSSIEEIVGLLDRQPQVAACAREMMTDKQAEWWMGFACKKCGASLAVQRSNDASKSGQHPARGWRVTCTSCGVTEYYEPGTTMVRMTVSN